MNVGKLVATISLSCLLALGALGGASRADAAPAWHAGAKPATRAASDVVEIKRRSRGRPLYLPIAPSLAYDYPYYYRRGFYPQHIGPGYIYYGYPYFYGRRYSARCSSRYWRCLADTRHKRTLNRRKEACRCR